MTKRDTEPTPFADALQRHRNNAGPGALAALPAQEGDGGISIQLMSDLNIRFADRDGQYVGEMDPHLALDVAQRLIQVANVALVKKWEAFAGDTATPVAPKPPKIDIVRGHLPRG